MSVDPGNLTMLCVSCSTRCPHYTAHHQIDYSRAVGSDPSMIGRARTNAANTGQWSTQDFVWSRFVAIDGRRANSVSTCVAASLPNKRQYLPRGFDKNHLSAQRETLFKNKEFFRDNLEDDQQSFLHLKPSSLRSSFLLPHYSFNSVWMCITPQSICISFLPLLRSTMKPPSQQLHSRVGHFTISLEYSFPFFGTKL